jgi:DNA-3-methyladenine glycosylase
MAGRILSPRFYDRDTVTVARELLGKRLVRVWRGKRLSGLIVETEAYLGPTDAAAHVFGGRRTERVRSMYLAGGHAYVYFVYGMHYCLNVVTKKAGQPEAVLIRALEPEPGVAERTDGPGRLCKALRIDRRLDGASLAGPIIFIERSGRAPAEEEIGSGPRIGVDYAGDAAAWPLRFTWKGHPHLSRRERSAEGNGARKRKGTV